MVLGPVLNEMGGQRRHIVVHLHASRDQIDESGNPEQVGLRRKRVQGVARPGAVDPAGFAVARRRGTIARHDGNTPVSQAHLCALEKRVTRATPRRACRRQPARGPLPAHRPRRQWGRLVREQALIGAHVAEKSRTFGAKKCLRCWYRRRCRATHRSPASSSRDTRAKRTPRPANRDPGAKQEKVIGRLSASINRRPLWNRKAFVQIETHHRAASTTFRRYERGDRARSAGIAVQGRDGLSLTCLAATRCTQ